MDANIKIFLICQKTRNNNIKNFLIIVELNIFPIRVFNQSFSCCKVNPDLIILVMVFDRSILSWSKSV